MILKKALFPAAIALTVMGSVNVAAQQTQPPVPTTLEEAWQQYNDVTQAVSDQLKQSPSYATDPTGHLDVMTGMMRTNIDNAMSSSATGFRGRPRWNEFDTPNVRIGVDNPDTRYMSAHIPNSDGQQIYRVWGKRSNSVDMIYLTSDASDPEGGGATIEDEDMLNTKGNPLQLGEQYEIYLSTAELYDPSYMHNWLEIGATDELNVTNRYTMCDWTSEKPGNIAVERIGTSGVAITAEEFRNEDAMRKGVYRATQVMNNQQPFWGNIASMIRNNPRLPANFVPPYTPTGGVGIQTQLSSFGYTVLADDEALVISYRNDTPAVYGSVQVWNDWGSSLPWGHSQANMNFLCDGSLSEETEDGLTHIVISKQDPGVHNWIDNMGYPVLFLNRLQGVDPEQRDAVMAQLPIAYGGYMPTARVVKVSELANILPADTKMASEKEREKQIEVRQKYQRTKYGNTW